MTTEDFQKPHFTLAFCNFVQMVQLSRDDPQLSPPSEGTCLLPTRGQSQCLGWHMVMSIQCLLLAQGWEEPSSDFLSMYC